MPTPTCPSPAATPASRPVHRAVRHLCPPQLCAALALCVQVLALLWPAAGHAHMMPAQQGTLNVVDNAVFGVLALPVSALDTDGSGASLGMDANGDGRLSAAELQAQAPALRAKVAQGFALHNGSERGELVLINLLAEPDERLARQGAGSGGTQAGTQTGAGTGAQAGAATPTPDAGSRHVLVLLKAQFSQPPTDLAVRIGLFGSREDERQLTLKVTRGPLTEAVVLRPSHAEARLLRPVGSVLASYVVTGVEHIVFGLDHVLFVVTLVVAGVGLRYWAGVLTAFTLAHSITLTAGLLGWVRINPAVVEPLIAASIVLMAALNLWQHARPRPEARPWAPAHTLAANPAATQPGAGWPLERMALVGACGLLHGLGFASSMADMGLHGSHRLASLAGFNLGIEIGQALCLVAILLALNLTSRGLAVAARHWPGTSVAPAAASLEPPRVARGPLEMGVAAINERVPARLWQAPVLASVVALAVGSFWLLQRLDMLG